MHRSRGTKNDTEASKLQVGLRAHRVVESCMEGVIASNRWAMPLQREGGAWAHNLLNEISPHLRSPTVWRIPKFS